MAKGFSIKGNADTTALGYKKVKGCLADSTLATKMVGVFNAALHNANVPTSFEIMDATSHTENGIVAHFGDKISYEIFFDNTRYKACVHEMVCGEVVAEFGGENLFSNGVASRGYVGGYKYHPKWNNVHEFSVARIENEGNLLQFIDETVAFLALCVGVVTPGKATGADTTVETVA